MAQNCLTVRCPPIRYVYKVIINAVAYSVLRAVVFWVQLI